MSVVHCICSLQVIIVAVYAFFVLEHNRSVYVTYAGVGNTLQKAARTHITAQPTHFPPLEFV